MILKNKLLALGAASCLALSISSASAFETDQFFVRVAGDHQTGKSSFKANTLKTDGTTDKSFTIKNKRLKGYSGGVGFGYAVSDAMLADLSFSYNGLKSKKNTTDNNITELKDKLYKMMFNGKYLFNPDGFLSPYLSGGLGVGLVKTTITAADATNGVKLNDTTKLAQNLKSKNTYYLSYQGGLGVMLQVMQKVGFDFGYNIGNSQGAKFKTVETILPADAAALNVAIKPKKSFCQTLSLGVQVML